MFGCKEMVFVFVLDNILAIMALIIIKRLICYLFYRLRVGLIDSFGVFAKVGFGFGVYGGFCGDLQ